MIRYNKLGYTELNVSDLKHSRRFYEEMVGLQPVDSNATRARFRCDADSHSVVLNQHTTPGLRCAGFMLEDESQFENLHRRLRDNGIPFQNLSATESDDRMLGRATRVMEPNSRVQLEFYIPASAQPAAFTPTHTKIQRLGHVVFHSPSRSASIAFFRDVLNFRESDSIGEAVTFTRPFPSPYHHGLGIVQGQRPLFHHLNFMVTEYDDIGKAFNRFKHNAVDVVFGPGRHLVSGSAFLYFLEPDGMTLEYSFGMEEFDEIDPRPAGVFPPKPETFDSWGSVPDPRFGSVGEIQ